MKSYGGRQITDHDLMPVAVTPTFESKRVQSRRRFMGITHFHTDHVNDLRTLLKGGYFFERDRHSGNFRPNAKF
ncbi:hypothetical protein O9992_19110 [Vibrio lentus]|nr:hypothetical protein [Vibrio lentus]